MADDTIPSNNAREPRRSTSAVALGVTTTVYWLAIFVLTHLPGTSRLGAWSRYLGRFGNLDKLAHLLAFAGLSLLLCQTLSARRRSGIAPYGLVLGITALYAIFDELTQQFVPYRSADLNDWFADMLGAGIGMSAFSLLSGFFASFRGERVSPAK